jgi:hypothetical protein
VVIEGAGGCHGGHGAQHCPRRAEGRIGRAAGELENCSSDDAAVLWGTGARASISAELRTDQEVATAAVEACRTSIPFVATELKVDFDFMLSLLQLHPGDGRTWHFGSSAWRWKVSTMRATLARAADPHVEAAANRRPRLRCSMARSEPPGLFS